MKNLINSSLLFTLLLTITSCNFNQAYSDGEWWAEEVDKMYSDTTYIFPTSNQFMRVKYTVEDCNLKTQHFFNGYKNYLKNEAKNKDSLISQLKLLKQKCSNKKQHTTHR